jgi:hypothetical protein
MPTSSIDDLLMGAKTPQHPETPEHQYQEGVAEIEEMELDAIEPEHEEEPKPERTLYDEAEGTEDTQDLNVPKQETDEYGNTKEPENEAIRERLARQARKHEAEINALRAQLAQQNAAPAMQQAVQDFEYDPEAQGDWQQQLKSFVKQTVNSMTREQEETQIRNYEAQQQREFEDKFRSGMENFTDFAETIQNLSFEITNPMTLATRGMANPAAFLYAAAKRNPQELERIAKIRDPYAQMTEMGKLEERMRKNTPTTKAPKPLSRVHDDSTIAQPKKQTEPTIEDLIARNDKNRLNRMKGRMRGR